MMDNDTSSSSILMCDGCGVEEDMVLNKKVCTSCEQKVYCKNSLDDNSLCNNDTDTPVGDDNNGSSDSNTEDQVVKFKAGDHITLQCNAAGIPYDHHAIILSTRSDGEGTLCVADFTAGDAGNAIRGTSGSGIVHSGSFGSLGSESDDHGLRVLLVDSSSGRKLNIVHRHQLILFILYDVVLNSY